MKKKMTRPKSFVIWLGDQIKKCDIKIEALQVELDNKNGVENDDVVFVIQERIEDLKKSRDDHEALYYQATGHHYDDIPF